MVQHRQVRLNYKIRLKRFQSNNASAQTWLKNREKAALIYIYILKATCKLVLLQFTSTDTKPFFASPPYYQEVSLKSAPIRFTAWSLMCPRPVPVTLLYVS